MNAFANALSAALNYAIVSHKVSQKGEPIGFLYREPPAFEQDSGWRFFSGMESDDYVTDATHFDTLPLSKILNMQPEIQHLMSETEGAWEWDDEAQTFIVVADWQPKA